ncbi:MAG: glycine--tRNA ligase subunit beta, partial [Sphingomicrobium sp.]
MADFLLELLSEEIPARMQAKARNDLARLFAGALQEAGLAHGAMTAFSTPRRLALIVRDVAAGTEAVSEDVKGPRTAAPPQALEGFLRKTGFAADQLEDRDGIWFAAIERAGRVASDVIVAAVAQIIADFPWPKSMRWGPNCADSADLRWVRPLHAIVALLGEDIVPIEIAGIASGATTLGHRFHHPGPITIGGATDYAEKLRACHVIVDQAERESIIRDGAATAAKAAGFTLIADEGLVVENAGLTEWPVPLAGQFDPDFLDVPREVIVLTMRTNQKYFACAGDDGGLAPGFVCVANIDANDGGRSIIEGNRRVLAARLADARFFWEQDVKIPLEEQAKKLDGIVFHEKLGTVADKVERVAKLARWLAEEGIVKGADAEQAERAARLAKGDLVTGMVGEFPELQGVIGGYLAEAQGEPKEIAYAIRDHYKPVGQGDEVPTAPVTVAVSLADKLDTLVSFFAIDEKPTGSKDPFALRRAALGILDLAFANSVRLPIRNGAAEAFRNFVTPIIAERYVCDRDAESRHNRITPTNFEAYLGRLAVLIRQPTDWSPGDKSEETYTVGPNVEEIIDFVVDDMVSVVESTANYMFDRIEERQRREGKRFDLMRAVVSKSILKGKLPPFGQEFQLRSHDYTTDDDPVRLLARVKALQAFVETDEGRDLLAGYKRAANILKKEGGSWSPDQVGGDEAATEEATLASALDAAEPTATAAIGKEDFTAAMAALASLRGPID